MYKKRKFFYTALNDEKLDEQRIENARKAMHRAITKIIRKTKVNPTEYWANIGRIMVDNPDLSIGFVVGILESIEEEKNERIKDFMPKNRK